MRAFIRENAGFFVIIGIVLLAYGVFAMTVPQLTLSPKTNGEKVAHVMDTRAYFVVGTVPELPAGELQFRKTEVFGWYRSGISFKKVEGGVLYIDNWIIIMTDDGKSYQCYQSTLCYLITDPKVTTP